MPRLPRPSYPNAWYHVMNRALPKMNLFNHPEHFELFLIIISKATKRFNIECHCYCLMSNHYHLILRVPESNLPLAMQYINVMYTKKYNYMVNQNGPLFRERYKSLLVEDDEYLLTLSRYIHLNPVEAKLVSNPDEYPWSSFKYYIQPERKPDWLRINEISSMISNIDCNIAYKEFVSDLI